MTIPFTGTPEQLRAKLIGVLCAAKSSPVSRATAQLDAAESLLKLGATSDEQALIRVELLAGIDGDRGYEPTHTVRACRILLEHPVEVTS